LPSLHENNKPFPKLIIGITKYWFIVFYILFTLPASSQAKSNYAIIITIDGLRPDAITNANTPFIIPLFKQGSYTLNARINDPPNTLSSHTSLVTGLKPNRHKMTFNFWFEGMIYLNKDTIFSIVQNDGMKTAILVGKDKLKYLAKPGSVNHFKSTSEAPTSIRDITSEFISYFKMEKPILTLIHFPEPDLSGHIYGWMSKEYLNAVEKVDQAIATIIETTRKTSIYDETIIIITSDHGGKGKTHKGTHDENMKVPWIAIGNKIKKNYKINDIVFIQDTAPTVLQALGIDPPEQWDGKTIDEIFINQY